MEKITLAATRRTVSGKSVSKLRKNGKLPAVLYGHGMESQHLELDERDFNKVFKKAGESTLVTLSFEGKDQPVLIQDVQKHYLKDNSIHVDFYAVRMDEKLTATVPLHFEGEAPAVKALGGILTKNISEVEVECLPADLPQYIEVELSGLDTFDKAIRVGDLKVSDKVKVLASEDEMIVTVIPPRSEEELKELEEKPVLDVQSVAGVAESTEAPTTEAAPETESKE